MLAYAGVNRRTSCPASVSALGERAGHVRQAAGLGQRRDLGGEQAHGQSGRIGLMVGGVPRLEVMMSRCNDF